MRIFTIGIIGFGYWGKILFRYFRNHEGFKLRRIATRHPDRIRKEIGNDIVVCLPSEVFSDNEIEAVIVATPIGTHYDLVLEALRNGKHVFSEKPLTLTSEKAFHIARLASEKGLNVFTDYTFTFSPSVKKMISLIREGAIGKVTGVIFQNRQLGQFLPYNVYIDLGCHALSVLDMLSPMKQMEFRHTDLFARDGILETGIINFQPAQGFEDEKLGGMSVDEELKSGQNNKAPTCGAIVLSFNHPTKVRNIAIYGERGTLLFDMMSEKPLQMLHYRVNRKASRLPDEKNTTFFDYDESNTLERVVDEFHKVLMGKTASNLEMSVRITGILEKLS